jgi:hypothetical protein
VSPTWSRDRRALWRRSGATVIVLSPGQPEPLQLTGSGQAVWELLDVPMDDEELTASLAELYVADEQQVSCDLRPFLERLAAAGVLARS